MTEQNSTPADDLPIAPPEGSRFGKAHHVLLIFTGLVLAAWLLSGIYQINNDQIAIVERLGTYVADDNGKTHHFDHGLHYFLPWPIDRVHKISLLQRRTLTVKAFNEPPEAYSEFKRELLNRGARQDVLSSLFDPYIITGDKNVVHVELAVQYLVDNPEAWLNTVSHAQADSDNTPGLREELFQEIAQHALTSQLARLPVDSILFTGQAQLPPTLLQAMEKDLTLSDPIDPHGQFYMRGVRIHAVDVVKARPPDRVKNNFDDVGKARADAAGAVTQGKATAASYITKANADKTNLILEAQGYRDQTVNAAKGEADRFLQVLKEYENSPDITRWNVYVDAVKSVSGNANRIFFVQPGQHTFITIEPPQFDANQPPAR